MRRTTVALSIAASVVASLLAAPALAHKFGGVPLSDVWDAAQNHNLCPQLPTEKLVAYMLSPTWWEVTGANSNYTPSPMTLSRGDNATAFYPPGQAGTSSPHRRAFWHPGIGAWQLDDAGLGSSLSVGKFNSRDSAIVIAQEMSERYCNSPTAYSVFGPWCACSSTGTCGASDRSHCGDTFNLIYNPNGPPAHPIESDPTVGMWGGAEERECRWAGPNPTFFCIYVDPSNAEGYTGEADGSPYGWTSYPDASTAPLAKPFYVFREISNGISYEWRYWMAADTGFGIDYAVRRTFPLNSRSGLDWIANADETTNGLCDVTLGRGVCSLSCGPAIAGGTVSGSCEPTAEIPVVTTATASGISQASASLNLLVNPKGAATQVWFDWGSNTNLTQTTASQSVGSGNTTLPASTTISGLSCGTTYFFRARAQNSQGSATPGATLQLTTASCGCGGSQSQNLIQNGTFGADSASWTLVGDFHADDRFLDYHDGPGYAYLSQSNGSPGNGLNGQIYQQVSIPSDATSATLKFWTKITTAEPTGGPAEDFLNATLQTSGGAFLASLQIYSNQNASSGYVLRTFNLVNYIGQTFRVHFLGFTNSDSQPTVFRIDDVSLDITRPAGSAPVVTTQTADQVTATSARLNLVVDPNDATTTVWFDFEPNDPTPSTDTEHISAGCGSQSVPASISVFGLQCNTLYYFEANASNTHGNDDGSTLQFTTSACPGGPPIADTDPAINIGQASATLRADVTANSLPTEAWFAWGTSAALGQETPHVSVGSASGSVEFSQALSGLFCGFTYYFRNYASNSAGQDAGATLSFTTQPCGTAQISATLDGSPWSGSVTFTIDGPVQYGGMSTPGSVVIPDGTYTLNYVSGGPPGSTLLSITPSPSQTLSGGGTLSFSLNFSSTAGYPINVVTGVADGITQSSAILHGTANPHGASTIGKFLYDRVTPWTGWLSSPSVNLGAGTTNQQYAVEVSGLTCGTQYYFMADAINAFGESDGGARTFETLACSAATTASCGRALLQQPRGGFGGCDVSDAGYGSGWSIAENFRVQSRRYIDCVEVLGYYWPGNDPPPTSFFRVAFYTTAANGSPAQKFYEGFGILGARQTTGTISSDGLEEWLFRLDMVVPVLLWGAGDYFVEVAGTSASGGSYCWEGGQMDPIAGLPGIAFRNTGSWSLTGGDEAVTLWERTILKDGFEDGNLSFWAGASQGQSVDGN